MLPTRFVLDFDFLEEKQGCKKVKKWNEESGVWESKCAEVLALFKKTMAPSIKLYLKGACVNYNLATRANIMDIIEQAN